MQSQNMNNENMKNTENMKNELDDSEACRAHVQNVILSKCEDRSVLAARWAAAKTEGQSGSIHPIRPICPASVPCSASFPCASCADVEGVDWEAAQLAESDAHEAQCRRLAMSMYDDQDRAECAARWAASKATKAAAAAEHSPSVWTAVPGSSQHDAHVAYCARFVEEARKNRRVACSPDALCYWENHCLSCLEDESVDWEARENAVYDAQREQWIRFSMSMDDEQDVAEHAARWAASKAEDDAKSTV
jgi:hypothetical protein